MRLSVINCNAQTGPVQLLQRLSQLCVTMSSNNGRVLKPKEGDRLVVFLKDVNLPRPDKVNNIF